MTVMFFSRTGDTGEDAVWKEVKEGAGSKETRIIQ
jgi:hypothetical protein